MPNMLNRMLIVATALLGPAAQVHIAAAQDSTYPRLVNNGGDVEVDYGPGPRGNILGGGQVVLSGGGDNMRITRLDPGPVQSGGLIATLTGGGDESRITYVQPQGSGTAMAAIAGNDPAMAAAETTMRTVAGR